MATADNVASFQVVLDSRQLVLGAEQGTKALDDLAKALKTDQDEIARINKAMSALAKGGMKNTEQFKALTQQLKAKKEAVAINQRAYLGFGGQLSDLSDRARANSVSWKELLSTLQGMPGPAGAVATALGKVGATLGGVGRAAAILGVAAALTAVTGAIVKQTVALYRYGTAQAEAIRNEKVMLGNLVTVRNMWGIAAGTANELSGAIDRVSGASSLSRDRVTGMAKSLYEAGFRGQNLSDALQGFATKSEVQGDAQAQLWLGYARAVALGGGSVKKMADTVQAQLGGRVQQMMLSSDVQAQKLGESYGALFGNLNMTPLLKAKANFNAMFSQGNAFGRSLRQLLGIVLQPLINAQAKVLPLMKRFFQGMILSAQRFVIQVLDVAIWVKETFGLKLPSSLGKSEDAFVKLGKVAFYVLGVTVLLTAALGIGLATSLTMKLAPALGKAALAMGRFGLVGLKTLGRLALGFGQLAVQVLLATWPILLAAAALWGLYKIGELLYVIWREIDWKDLGRTIWQGIVKGVEEGWTGIKNAMSKLGDIAKNALKALLGIASPSKVFAELGEEISAGLAIGVKAGESEVDQTVRHLVEPPKVPGSGGGGGGAGAAGGGRTITFNFGDINIGGAGGQQSPQQLAQSLMDELEKRLTDAALELGVAV